MSHRGKGIPFEIKIKIAEIFEKEGFNKDTRLSAEELYDKLSKSANPISRSVTNRPPGSLLERSIIELNRKNSLKHLFEYQKII